MESSDLLNIGSLIIVRDLNVVLLREEFWGLKCHSDPLSDRINSLFDENHLVNICPISVEPTWHNGRCGSEYIGKRLERFMVHRNLFAVFGNFRCRVENTYIFDHYPIVLQWRAESVRRGIPFKFNRISLEDEYFINLVRSVGKYHG